MAEEMKTNWLTITEPMKIDGQDNLNPVTNKPYSSTLNRNEVKKHEKSPDYSGPLHLQFSDEILEIIKNNGGKLKCSLSGWERDGVNGKFMSLQVQHAVKSEEPVAATEQVEFN